MSENQPNAETTKLAEPLKPAKGERLKNAVVFLTIVTTVIVTVVAGVQVETGIRAARANRDSQFLAIKIAGGLQRTGLQGNYDMALFSSVIQDRLTATVLQLTALQMKSQGDNAGAASAQLHSDVATARADVHQAASILYTDFRYKPSSSEGQPDAQRYLKNLNAEVQEMLTKQNAASDEYNTWNGKADALTAALTVFAIALFLFGLAQALSPRLRLVFAVLGILAAGFGTVWAAVTLFA